MPNTKICIETDFFCTKFSVFIQHTYLHIFTGPFIFLQHLLDILLSDTATNHRTISATRRPSNCS